MLLINKILKLFLLRILTSLILLLILVNILIQSVVVGDKAEQKVLCIKNNSHLSIESNHKYTFCNNDIDKYLIFSDQQPNSVSSNSKDNGCVDIYLSFIDVYKINIISKIIKINQSYFVKTNKITRNYFCLIKNNIINNQPLQKILREYSTVSLLL